jgi:16S rRNA A1518/A1519 N6-dimethyltransferase RsmA/KsgA/DIM1 with predicted DNA glycosylase/AP lyase activity
MSIVAKKSLGQHFLVDGNLIRKIVASLEPHPGDPVIEIGPGTGALTRSLYARHPDMIALEVDLRAIEVLKRDMPGLDIRHQDVLDVDWGDITSGCPPPSLLSPPPPPPDSPSSATFPITSHPPSYSMCWIIAGFSGRPCS